MGRFAELLEHDGVEEDLELRSSFGLMAFHGGNLEEGTDVIAAAVAEQAGASLYAVRQPVGLRWHLPSVEIGPADSPALAAFLDHVDVAVAVHGYGRDGMWTTLLLGGQHRALAAHVGAHLRAAMPRLRGDRRPRADPDRAARRPPRQPGEPARVTVACSSSCRPAPARAPFRCGATSPTPQPVPHQHDLIAGLVAAVRSLSRAWRLTEAEAARSRPAG